LLQPFPAPRRFAQKERVDEQLIAVGPFHVVVLAGERLGQFAADGVPVARDPKGADRVVAA
jgi:hypothetical protein